MVGTTIGHYHVLALLGRGAMGEVYLAVDERLRRKVAIKVLPAAFADDPDRRHHFQREARALGSLSHPGIVSIHGVEQEGDAVVLAMEFVDGTPLGALIPSEGMPFEEVLRIGASLAEAIGAAHRQGVVHRDLKPSNVMVTPGGAVKVLDFGLARIRRAAGADTGAGPAGSSSATVPGTVIGTAHYMSPEQAQGLPVDARSDIFSLGVVLYHLATGHRPFDGETPMAVLSSIIKDTAPPLTGTRPDLPAAFSRLVARCLEKDPDRRVQDALDLAAQLRDIAADRDAAKSRNAPADTSRWRSWWKMPGHPWRWGWALTLMLAVAVGAVATWRANRRAPSATVLDAGRVAVAPFENRTRDATLDAVGLMSADRIAEGLVEQLALPVVPGPVSFEAWPTKASVPADSEAEDRVRLLAQRVGAAIVVSGDYYTVGSEIAFRARLTDVREGREVAQFGPVTGPRDAPDQAVQLLTQRVVGEAAIHFKGGGGAATAGIPPHFTRSSPPMPYEAYREFLAGLDAFDRDLRTAISHLERVEVLYPHRALVLPWLVLSYMRVGAFEEAERHVRVVKARMAPEDMPLVEYFSARLEGRWLDAYNSIRKFQRTMPQHLPTVNTTAGAALALGRPHEAAALLASVDVTPWLDSTSGRAWLSMRADAEHMLGRYEEERLVAEQLAAAAGAPGGSLVRSLAALGRVDEITAALDGGQLTGAREFAPSANLVKQAIQELRAHGHTEASRTVVERGLRWMTALDAPATRNPAIQVLRGDLLSLAGQWRQAAAVFARVASEHPDDIAALSGLGVALARRGDTSGAERASDRLLRLDRPYLLGSHVYGRARIASALGQQDRAVLLLQQAFAEGQAIIWRTHGDVAFDELRGYPPFDRLTGMDHEQARDIAGRSTR